MTLFEIVSLHHKHIFLLNNNISITPVRNHSHHNNNDFIYLLHKMRFLTFLFFSFIICTSFQSVAQERYRLVFWNVENLFDIYNDSTHHDEDFTPAGQYHWTAKRYKTKLNHLYKTIVAMGDACGGDLNLPLVVGMAEVENDKVLRDLCQGTMLRRFRYNFIHFESSDWRGIDCALLYRRDIFHPFFSQSINVGDSNSGFTTRDILLVQGTINESDTIILLVNHFPSKRNTENEHWRTTIAQKLRYIMDTVTTAHPTAAIITMGDFNATPQEQEIRHTLMQGDDRYFVNLMASSDDRGSYKYQGQWSFIDQIIVSRNLIDPESSCPFLMPTAKGNVFDAGFLLIDDERYLGKKMFRTYLGFRYQGGYSDHLPIYVDIKRK